MLRTNVYIGAMIMKMVKEKMTVSEFARRLNFPDRRYAYSLFNKKTIDTDMLINIGKVLGHNFLLEYFEEKPAGRKILLIEGEDHKIDEIIEKYSVDKSLTINTIHHSV